MGDDVILQRAFLRLGAGKSARYGVGPAAAWLDRAAAAGLPTPAGIIVLDEAWQQLQAEGVVVVEGEDVHVTGADALLARLALRQPRRPLALRPAFSQEGRPVSGGFPSRLNLAPDAPYPLIHALVEVWQAGQAAGVRCDILVTEMVAGGQSGTAITQAGSADDEVRPEGQAPYQLPQLAAGRRPQATAAVGRRLQQLLRGVRRTFHQEGNAKKATNRQNLGLAWEIEWVDDGAICWLWQVRLLET